MICSEGNKQREEELQRLIRDYIAAETELEIIDCYHKIHREKLKKALSTLTVAELQEVLSMSLRFGL